MPEIPSIEGLATEEYVNSALGNLTSINFTPVTGLPTENISTTTIYLLPIEGDTNNTYEEYIYVNDTWEKIGTTSVDLTNVVTTDTEQTIYARKTFASSGNNQSFLYLEGDKLVASTSNMPEVYKILHSDNLIKFYANTDFTVAGRDNVNLQTYGDVLINTLGSDKFISLQADKSQLNLKQTTIAEDEYELGLTTNAKYMRIGGIETGLTIDANHLSIGTANGLYLQSEAGDPETDDYSVARIEHTNTGMRIGLEKQYISFQESNNRVIIKTPLIQPVASEKTDLGTSTQRFKDIYLSGSISDGTNSITIADLVTKVNAGSESSELAQTALQPEDAATTSDIDSLFELVDNSSPSLPEEGRE